MSGLKYFLLGFTLVSAFAFSVESFAAPVQYEATSVGAGRYTTSGFGSPINFKVTTAGVSKYKQLVPVVSPTTLTKFAKKLVRGGGVGLAIAAAVEGLGYLIDQATGEIKRTDQQFSGGTTFWNMKAPPPSVNSYGTDLLSDKLDKCRMLYSGCYSSIFPFDFRTSRYVVTHGGTSQDSIIDLEPSDWSRIESTLDSSLSSSDKTRIINSILSGVSVSGRLDTSDYPSDITSTNPDLDQLYQDWPELHSSVKDLVNSQMSEFIASENTEHTLTPEEQALADSTSVAPVAETATDTESELSLDGPPMFSATVESWWVPIYPEGVSGIFSDFIDRVSTGPFIAILNPLKSLPDGGSPPVWSMNFDIGSMGNYGNHSFEVPFLVWAFVRFCILFTAVMLVRNLIFGG